MDFALLIKALIMGISIAAPVGPIGVLCIQRTLAQGKMAGLVSGLGAACADLMYGLVAGLGITFISQFLISHHLWIQFIGGIFLLFLGGKTLISKATDVSGRPKMKNLFSAFFTVFFQTLTNPMTILSFTAIFAGLGMANSQTNSTSAILLVAGIFLGSALWWLFLSIGVGFFQTKITTHMLTIINRVSGMVIILFGAFSLLTLIQ